MKLWNTLEALESFGCLTITVTSDMLLLKAHICRVRLWVVVLNRAVQGLEFEEISLCCGLVHLCMCNLNALHGR
jgi:hypothetical protein